MPRAIRRVVTGHNAAGRSVFINDAAAPHVYNRGPGSAVVTVQCAQVIRRTIAGPVPGSSPTMFRSPPGTGSKWPAWGCS